MVGWPAAELCTGERVVVFLFVSCVLLSAPLSLLYEVLALAVLASAGLLVEIAAERSPAPLRFKTRPGASSGILLGSVTFPTVMLSQMIQLSRMLSGSNFGPEDIAHFSRQYWTVSASSVSVLVFLCLVLYQPPKSASSFAFERSWISKLILLHSALCLMARSFSTVKMHDSGWAVMLDLFWLFCCGLTTIMLVKHILYKFPSCVSIGEALHVCSGLILYCGDMLACTLVKVQKFILSSTVSYAGHRPKTEIAIFIQGMILGLLLLPLFYKTVLWGVHYLTILKKPETLTASGWTYRMIETLLFFGSLVVLLTILVPAWLHFVQDFHMHPVLWIFKFVFTDPLKCLGLCIYWICLICFSVLRFYNISKHSKTERILLRKYYHLMAVLMFSPALLIQPDFLDLAFGTALGVFLVLEMIRIWNIWPLGHIVHQFMNAFTDHRDSEILIISHFSLLLGCALPKWISPGFKDRPLAPFAGILSLGIGDTMASVVGHKYGVLRWSKTGKKTIEGTAAGITSVLIACSMLLPLVASTGYILSQHWLSLLGAVTISGLLEAFTAQLDNAFIPLIFYSLLCL